MLYTGKGDKGTTKLFDCPQGTRLTKSSFVFEVLGTIDELNCTLGYTKVLSRKSNDTLNIGVEKIPYEEIIEIFQQNLFFFSYPGATSSVY
ncbi:ATP:cob(I)alamin adenosyltransferase [Streptococcus pneumoniae]|uniref:ATP:cob(I)alamin adenosyltransferase n=1 Tax=Streptococcus pneumoniae TaxID=1313 RepID=UPI00344BFAF8